MSGAKHTLSAHLLVADATSVAIASYLPSYMDESVVCVTVHTEKF